MKMKIPGDARHAWLLWYLTIRRGRDRQQCLWYFSIHITAFAYMDGYVNLCNEM